MHLPGHFQAPWSGSLKLLSVLGGVAFAGAGVALLIAPGPPPVARGAILAVFLLIPVLCALYTIRGYEIGRDALYVQRLLWRTRISLQGLQAVEADPEATRRSFRALGNGGLFSFSGWYRNKKLGPYRLCATDPRRSVVLRFPTRIWVVSPDRTDEFIQAIKEKTGL